MCAPIKGNGKGTYIPTRTLLADSSHQTSMCNVFVLLHFSFHIHHGTLYKADALKPRAVGAVPNVCPDVNDNDTKVQWEKGEY
jgi:hypothetical protein